MEGLTRLVTESLARHGFDRPLDYRRLKWSRWFRCESPHSLLFVPSQPGVFALAEEIVNLSAPYSCASGTEAKGFVEERRFSAASALNGSAAVAAVPDVASSGQDRAQPLLLAEAELRRPEAEHRMLAVSQFFEADDMAFVLDRMLSYQNPMRARLASGRYFVRYVVIEDESQRRSITSALNQWIVSSAEKATGIGLHFASSLELAPATEQTHVGTSALAVPRTLSNAKGSSSITSAQAGNPSSTTAPQPDPGAATNINCPSPFPAGF